MVTLVLLYILGLAVTMATTVTMLDIQDIGRDRKEVKSSTA